MSLAVNRARTRHIDGVGCSAASGSRIRERSYAMQLRARIGGAFWGILALTAVPNLAAAGSAGHDVQAWLSAAAASRAIAVSGPVISVVPLALDFGVVNI